MASPQPTRQHYSVSYSHSAELICPRQCMLVVISARRVFSTEEQLGKNCIAQRGGGGETTLLSEMWNNNLIKHIRSLLPACTHIIPIILCPECARCTQICAGNKDRKHLSHSTFGFQGFNTWGFQCSLYVINYFARYEFKFCYRTAVQAWVSELICKPKQTRSLWFYSFCFTQDLKYFSEQLWEVWHFHPHLYLRKLRKWYASLVSWRFQNISPTNFKGILYCCFSVHP